MERCSGFFETPNQAALCAALVSTALGGIWLGLSGRTEGRSRVLLAVIMGLAIAGALGLQILCASRAGVVATMLAAAIFALALARNRHVAVVACGACLLALIVVVVLRACSDAAVSPEVRLPLWRATLVACASFPIAGAGSDAQRILEDWLLPASASGQFASSLNDFLTLSLRHGLLVGGVGMAVALALLTGLWRRRVEAAPLTLLAFMVVFLTMGCFQAHLLYPWSSAVFAALVVASAICVRRHVGARTVGWCALAAAAVVLSLFAWGRWMADGVRLFRSGTSVGVMCPCERSDRVGGTVLVCVNARSEITQWRGQMVACARDGYAVLPVVPGGAWAAERPLAAVVGLREGAIDRLAGVGRAGQGAPAYLIDPQEFHARRLAAFTRVTVLLSRMRLFVPDEQDIAESARAAGVEIALAEVGRDQGAFDIIRRDLDRSLDAGRGR